MTTHEPGDDGATPPPGGAQGPSERPVRVWVIVLGAVLGVVVTWLVFTVTLLTLYATEGQNTPMVENILAAVGLFGLPLLLGLLLIPRRTRQLGAGFLVGLAAGSIAGAGICAGMVSGSF